MLAIFFLFIVKIKLEIDLLFKFFAEILKIKYIEIILLIKLRL